MDANSLSVCSKTSICDIKYTGKCHAAFAYLSHGHHNHDNCKANDDVPQPAIYECYSFKIKHMPSKISASLINRSIYLYFYYMHSINITWFNMCTLTDKENQYLIQFNQVCAEKNPPLQKTKHCANKLWL